MSSCEQLNAWLDGDLDAVEKADFEVHAKDCASCQLAMAQWGFIAEAIQDTASETEIDPSLPDHLAARRIATAFEKRPSGRPQTLRYAWLAVAAVLLVALALGIWSASRGDTGKLSGISQDETIAGTVFGDSAPSPRRWTAGEEITVGDRASALIEVAAGRIGLDEGTTAAVKPLKNGSTRVVLRRGRVAAEVRPRTKDAPFIVEAGELSVRVLGTIFSVERREDKSIAVSVLRGKVEVSRNGKVISSVSAGKSLFLDASGQTQQLSLDPDAGAQMEKLATTGRRDHSKSTPSSPDSAPIRPQEEQKSRDTVSSGSIASAAQQREWESWIIAGRYDETRTTIGKHLRTNPGDSRAWSLLANCEKRAGNWSAAIDSYRKAARTSRGTQAGTARFQAAVLLQDKLSRHEEAAEMFHEFTSTNQNSPLVAEATLREARSRRAIGQRAQSDALLRQITTDHPGSAAAIEARRLLNQAP